MFPKISGVIHTRKDHKTVTNFLLHKFNGQNDFKIRQPYQLKKGNFSLLKIKESFIPFTGMNLAEVRGKIKDNEIHYEIGVSESTKLILAIIGFILSVFCTSLIYDNQYFIPMAFLVLLILQYWVVYLLVRWEIKILQKFFLEEIKFI